MMLFPEKRGKDTILFFIGKIIRLFSPKTA